MHVFIKAKVLPNALGETPKFAVRARRFWPVGTPLKVEVLDTKEDGPDVELTPGGATGPDMTKIGRDSFDAIGLDDRFSILSDLDSQAIINDDAVNAARKAAQEASGRVVELEAENAGLRARAKKAEEVAERAQGEAFEAGHRAAQLEEQLAAAKAELSKSAGRIVDLESENAGLKAPKP